MTMKKTIGGDRLGSGAKMKVDLKTYNRSTHDLGYIWRSTMAAGTLVPFMKKVTLPGDTFDIDLEVDVKTHPTLGPLFGSYKVQLDVFSVPVRLYNSALHNNAVGIGTQMAKIKLPKLGMPLSYTAKEIKDLTATDLEQMGYNPSSLLSYLGMSGGGVKTPDLDQTSRNGNAVPYLGYWDIYKNYYANKQEEIGMFVNNVAPSVIAFTIQPKTGPTAPVPEAPATSTGTVYPLNDIAEMHLLVAGTIDKSAVDYITFGLDFGGPLPYQMPLSSHFNTIEVVHTGGGTRIDATDPKDTPRADDVVNYQWLNKEHFINITISDFPLENIDTMRENILGSKKFDEFILAADGPDEISPYKDNLQTYELTTGEQRPKSSLSQQGLALKTYQSDIFNNWLNSEIIDNTSTGINAITAVSTAGDSFTIDSLILARKVYEMLNRIAISGGTYDDWLETVYTHQYINRTEIPVYQGGIGRELVFQEVVSNSESESGQPLGTLAGKGVMGQRKKGGKIVVKTDEIGYIMGIISITPRIDYSQGNDWDINLDNMDSFHKPALDEIGFQDLITDQMAWWTTYTPTLGQPEFKSAGKQPAWINYMTSVNVAKGNFALQDNEMFMTLNRRYEMQNVGGMSIKDLTTYIDPAKFNFIFAETDLTSQNFWVNVSVDITARRKMSAKIMPNL